MPNSLHFIPTIIGLPRARFLFCAAQKTLTGMMAAESPFAGGSPLFCFGSKLEPLSAQTMRNMRPSSKKKRVSFLWKSWLELIREGWVRGACTEIHERAIALHFVKWAVCSPKLNGYNLQWEIIESSFSFPIFVPPQSRSWWGEVKCSAYLVWKKSFAHAKYHEELRDWRCFTEKSFKTHGSEIVLRLERS